MLPYLALVTGEAGYRCWGSKRPQLGLATFLALTAIPEAEAWRGLHVH